ncbi:hypothetical protein O181_092161 [Austropuccinia psidii MF-1]|uniref:Uncharacterized protein n=1 Tax=Austropuccinia psidii MF-1 TaxID=1389203 RepID=A0A9Q3IYT9_9BASI|nr:hypothetical protein [Austropuccinia psidii MF-1]
MVTFSEPNHTFPAQGPKIQCPFQTRTFQLISLEIHGGNQKIIQGPQPPDSAGVGCQGIKYFNTPWKTQLVHKGDNSINLYVFGPIGPIQSSTVGLQSQSSISRWAELYWPISDNTASDPPSRISLSVFHIYWPPFSTWGLFPQNQSLLFLLSLEPSKQTRSQARAQAALTPTPRVPLDGTPAVPQLRAQLDRGRRMEGAEPSRKEGRGPRRSISLTGVVGSFPEVSRTNRKVQGEDDDDDEENSVEEEESDVTEGLPAPVRAPQSTGGPTLAQSDQPVSNQSEPSLWAIMQQMTQIMASLQADSSSGSSRPPAFKTPYMNEPECFDGTQPFSHAN